MPVTHDLVTLDITSNIIMAQSLDIIAISQSTKFLLTSCIPYIELNRSSVGMEHKGIDLNTQGSYMLLNFTR